MKSRGEPAPPVYRARVSQTPASPRPVGRVGVALVVHDTDRHRVVTVLALLAATATVALVVLGLPPIDLHGPLHGYGVMWPTCGATRATWFAARGDLGRSWDLNPLGAVVVGGSALAVLRALVGVSTSRWVSWSVTTTPRARRVLGIVAVLAFVALEALQQSRAALLMGP